MNRAIRKQMIILTVISRSYLNLAAHSLATGVRRQGVLARVRKTGASNTLMNGYKS
jgi:hypothetical protein